MIGECMIFVLIFVLLSALLLVHSLPNLKIYLFMSKKSCNFWTDVYNDSTKVNCQNGKSMAFGIAFVETYLNEKFLSESMRIER